MATRVTITKALEEKLRKEYSIQPEPPAEDLHEMLGEVIKLLDAEQDKRERSAIAKDPGVKALGYKELVALFRAHLGAELLVPPKPSTPYIVKLLNRARDYGVDHESAIHIVQGARRGGKGPYRLGDLIYGADRLFALGSAEEVRLTGGEDAGVPGENQQVRGPIRQAKAVYTGRPDFDDED